MWDSVEMDCEMNSAEHGSATREGPVLAPLDLRQGDRVLVLGGYGVKNVGDEAILAGLLSTLPPHVHVRVVSRAPRETAKMHCKRFWMPLPMIPLSRLISIPNASSLMLKGEMPEC